MIFFTRDMDGTKICSMVPCYQRRMPRVLKVGRSMDRRGQACRWILLGLGNEVETVADGETAWQRLNTSHHFDWVVTDPSSLGSGEFPLAEMIRASGLTIPVALLPPDGTPPESWELRWLDHHRPASPLDLETLTLHVRSVTATEDRHAECLLNELG
jgi:DNA-binding NtrC family response regulator